jgi:hypothetical protein
MFNTVNHVMRGRIRTTGGTAYTEYITSANLKIMTQATRNQAHGTLGSVLTTFGRHQAMVEVNAFFTKSDVIAALIAGDTVAADWALRNGDGAIVYDMPACQLGGGKRNFPQNEVVTIDLTANAKRDTTFNTSLIVSRLPYCPAS